MTPVVPVAVVVPYFQREPGILARALNSVAAQTVAPSLVIVVDDGSPHPARAETAAFEVRLIEQPNGGPSSARNTALRAIPHGIEFVALLDSDDEWDPSHLANAIEALEHGCDAYFADFSEPGESEGKLRDRGIAQLSDHAPLSATKPLYGFGGSVFEAIVRQNPIHTSTLVFRRRAAGSLMFREEQRVAGEDLLFFLDLARRAPCFAFSAALACRCGGGINVYRAATLGTDGAIGRIVDETRLRRMILSAYPLSLELRAVTRSKLSRLRAEFVENVLYRVRHGRHLDLRKIGEQFALDPPTLYLFAPLALRCLSRHALAVAARCCRPEDRG